MPEREDRLDYGVALRRLRTERGLTLYDLADRAGVSASYLSEVERGIKRPSTDVLARIARALGMAPSDLLAYIESLTVPADLEGPVPKAPAPIMAAAFEAPRADWTERAAMESLPTSPRDSAMRLLISLARRLPDEDLRLLLDLARRLLERGTPPRSGPSTPGMKSD